MSTLRRVVLLALSLLGLSACAAAPGSVDIVSGSEARSYVLAAPGTGSTPRPLVIALHGWLGTPSQMQDMSGFSAAAAHMGFAVVYPKGDWRA